MRTARTARRSIRLKAPPAAVLALLKADPTPELQRRVGIDDHRRLSPTEWAFRQGGEDVRCRIAREGPGFLELELERAGERQVQRFASARAWRGTLLTLAVELAEPAPLPRLKGYLQRTLRLVKEVAEERARR